MLEKHGIARVRGLGKFNDVPSALRNVASLITDLELRPYTEQSSPRTEVGSSVYTVTDFPKHADLFLHNELSYATSWPRMLIFYCHTPAETGGETMVADCHTVYSNIPEDIRLAFEAKSWMYIRNLLGHSGLGWQSVFQTSDTAKVERYCVDNDVEIEWTADGPRLSAVRPPTLSLGDEVGKVWFNHIAVFHVSTSDLQLSSALRRIYSSRDLPVNTYFGDGSEIPDDVVAAIRGAYTKAAVSLQWREGDLVAIDNCRIAHGRKAYRGDRRIYVALAGNMSRN
jgi:hypothetical protein